MDGYCLSGSVLEVLCYTVIEAAGYYNADQTAYMKVTLFQNERLVQFLIIISSVCAITTFILLELYNTTSSLRPESSNHTSPILTQTQMVRAVRTNPYSVSCLSQLLLSGSFAERITSYKSLCMHKAVRFLYHYIIMKKGR